jgi:hypothetical protein
MAATTGNGTAMGEARTSADAGSNASAIFDINNAHPVNGSASGFAGSSTHNMAATTAGPGGGLAMVTRASGTTSNYSASSGAISGPIAATGSSATAGSSGGSRGVTNSHFGNASGFSNGGGTEGIAGAGANASTD